MLDGLAQCMMGYMHITRYGHASVLVEIDGTRILVDPGIFSPPETFELAGLDAIIVTHQHADHLDPARVSGLLTGNPDAQLLCDAQSAGIRHEEYGEQWITHTAGDETRIGVLSVIGVGGNHARILDDLPLVSNIGIIIQTPDQIRLFHPGDSYDYVPDDIDVLALPLSAPWTKISETAAFLSRIGPADMFYIHDCTISERAYGTYASHAQRFAPGRVHALGQRETLTV